MRFAAVALVAIAGCALPLEEHGGAAPKPEASDLVFIGAGAATDVALQVAHLPWWARLSGVAALTYSLRIPKWGGRNEGVAVTVPFGAFFPEAFRFIHEAKKHDCQYAGMDGVVHSGVLHNGECV